MSGLFCYIANCAFQSYRTHMEIYSSVSVSQNLNVN